MANKQQNPFLSALINTIIAYKNNEFTTLSKLSNMLQVTTSNIYTLSIQPNFHNDCYGTLHKCNITIQVVEEAGNHIAKLMYSSIAKLRVLNFSRIYCPLAFTYAKIYSLAHTITHVYIYTYK